MKVTLIYQPEKRELMLFKRCIWVTMGKTEEPKKSPSSGLLRRVLRARHSPIRVLNFAFLIEEIPSNTATHLARHIHAVPFISSLRNDRQGRMDGDAARRDTPVDMIFYCNAEELMTVANTRPQHREELQMTEKRTSCKGCIHDLGGGQKPVSVTRLHRRSKPSMPQFVWP